MYFLRYIETVLHNKRSLLSAFSPSMQQTPK